ncbi:hypothetical protein DL766_006900 [Monosporascus sp. MC13-8B]|uniref:SCP domain-containing protein n=1 Tax=Monosporascus cannonballus TaxID=155416 RepID=A0ABY0HFT4_9PEZI|nr:hypothetical protein DL762_001635 [Monosporascus cannonballus]RYP01553.1 hypothetical protein DL763_000084 [Monosporascus cannonballus]RYP25837.1 hypothetical protein DL766_006900 [Monosporascus sp. MC13-8B]
MQAIIHLPLILLLLFHKAGGAILLLTPHTTTTGCHTATPWNSTSSLPPRFLSPIPTSSIAPPSSDPSPPSTILALAAETPATPELAAASVPTPTTPPRPVDEEAAHEFREKWGDQYRQTTYWSCAASEGVFKGHCGWHEPIIAVEASGASAAKGRPGECGGVVARVGVVAVAVAAAVVMGG